MSDASAAARVPVPETLAPPAFDANALRVLKERYFAKKPDGTTETPTEFLWRVAAAIAEPERRFAAKLGRDASGVVAAIGAAFYDMMARRDFMPNTPCLVNAGRPLSMLSACFVLPVPDSIEGIFYSLKAMALIQKSGGGCVSADSRVWTTFCGLEPIEVLFNRATADGRGGTQRAGGIAYDVRDLGIRTVSMDGRSGRTGLKGVSHVWKFDVPANAQIVVRTREGVEVQTSAWHPFMVLRGREFTQVRAAELTPGDVILGPERPDHLWPWTQHRAVAGLTLDENIGWLIGLTLSAGSFDDVPALRQEGLRWLSRAPGVLDRVRAVLLEHGIDAGVDKDPGRNTYCVSTFDQDLVAAMFAACGFAKGGSNDARIRIPEYIAKSPLPVVRAFLAGLLDGGGSVDDDGSPSYTTISTEMAHDLAAFMSLLGYRPTLSRKEAQRGGEPPAYTVALCPPPQVDELARDIAPFVSNALRKGRLRGDVRRETAMALRFADRGDACDVSAAELLRSIARRGQEIESVAPAERTMAYYDLTVDEWNTYAAGRTGLALIHNTGFAFSELRHQGAEVASTGKDASGPVSFMKVFNAATDSIKQGGVRRGANMGVLKVDHPDVFHFMSSKKDLDAENRALWNRMSDTGRYTAAQLAHIKQELLQTQINNFNISIGVTDEFMQAVQRDGAFDLRDPRTNDVVRSVKAREIWDGIVDGAWQNGEPGVLFLDHPDVNPLPGLGPIQATNPCVTADTWVTTAEGARRVSELVGRPFTALVDGKAYASTGTGFFFTGVKPVFRVATERGFELRATANHEVLIERDAKRAWIAVGDIALGDDLVLHDHDGASWPGDGTFDEGRLASNVHGAGHLHVDGRAHAQARARHTAAVGVRGDRAGTAVLERELHGDRIERASSEFIRGFLQGRFDADGAVHGSHREGVSVRLSSSDGDDLAAAQRMLARFGIVSTIYRGRRPAPRAQHELVLSGVAAARFAHRVGFGDEVKQARLRSLVDSRPRHCGERDVARVSAVVAFGEQPVFDCTIPGIHAFDANGIYAHNCGEQYLHGYDSCNLGSINVGNFYSDRAKEVDWERLGQTTCLALRFLDNVIDANVYPIDEIRDMVTANRRVGLGIMGFAELLIKLEIAYGSPEAIAFARRLMEFIQQRAEEASELLARERGNFPNKHLSKWADDVRPRRNAALLSIAPTGTISMIAGCSFGCEPYFGMAYTKHVMKDAEGRPQHLYYVVPLFEQIARAEGFYSDDLLAKIEENRGSVKGLAEVPQAWQNVFTTSADVTVDQHVDMLAAFQKNTCNAVSKTINAPNDDTRENVARAIFRAYEAGCKGFTYYRDGSRTEQVVTFSKEGDLAGGNRDIAASAGTKDQGDIDALLAKASALLEVR